MQAAFPVTPWSGSDRKLFYGTARVMNLSALRRTRAGRWAEGGVATSDSLLNQCPAVHLPAAPHGRTSPFPDTGSPTSPASTVPLWTGSRTV